MTATLFVYSDMVSRRGTAFPFLSWLYWALWLGAVASALISLWLHARMKSWPWYVALNLAINSAGLLLSICLLGSAL